MSEAEEDVGDKETGGQVSRVNLIVWATEDTWWTWLHMGMAHYPTALLYTAYDDMRTACYLVKGDTALRSVEAICRSKVATMTNIQTTLLVTIV